MKVIFAPEVENDLFELVELLVPLTFAYMVQTYGILHTAEMLTPRGIFSLNN